MKNLITILILFAFGCGKSLTEEEKLVGTYEAKRGETTLKIVFLENRKAEKYSRRMGNFFGEQKVNDGTWKLVGKEVHLFFEKEAGVFKIETNGDLTMIAEIIDGKRKDKQDQYTWKKFNPHSK